MSKFCKERDIKNTTLKRPTFPYMGHQKKIIKIPYYGGPGYEVILLNFS